MFDFASDEYPEFEKFLGQSNAELLQVLQTQQERLIYVWGAESVGKSHLLQAWVGQAVSQGKTALYLHAGHDELTDYAREFEYLAVDQVDLLSAEEQIILFSIFNEVRDGGRGYLLLSSDVPPSHLYIREDLRTRMGYCLVYEVRMLTYQEKADALRSFAKIRQIPIDDELINYLLANYSRDLDRLIFLLEQLGQYSLMVNKRVNLALLKKILQQSE
jgi:DnaA family protein